VTFHCIYIYSPCGYHIYISMSQAIPRTVKQWTVIGQDGLDSLKFTEEELESTLGDNQVLVKSKHYDIQSFINANMSPSPRSVSKRMLSQRHPLQELIKDPISSVISLSPKVNTHGRSSLTSFRVPTVLVPSWQLANMSPVSNLAIE
jgi:hypothetical protein